VVLTDKQGQVVDEVPYSAKMHFPLIRNPQGVALERIDAAGPSASSHNWHSAAASAGYGTPGYANSQLQAQAPPLAGLKLGNTLFTPDNDGQEDVLLISYQWPESGYMIRMLVFDDQGRPVRELVKNELMEQRAVGNGMVWTIPAGLFPPASISSGPNFLHLMARRSYLSSR
jgi:hypothetical protein